MIVLSPNRWSCLACSFAQALGVTLEEIIEFVGHDGSQIINPLAPEPFCRKSFHPQEMIDFCLSLGKGVTEIQKFPTSINEYSENERTVFELGKAFKRFEKYLSENKGVLCGYVRERRVPHAVYWDQQNIIDSNGTVYELGKFNTTVMFMVKHG